MESEISIVTERLTLRPLTRADIPRIVELVNDFEVSRWLTVVPFPYTAADGHEFLDFLEGSGPLDTLAIIAPEGMVGVVGTGGSLGYWLGREYHGQGYMTEAATALVDHYFQTSDAEILHSGYFTGNNASSSVLTKLGFVPNGGEHVNSVAQGIEVTLEKVVLTRKLWVQKSTAIVSGTRVFLRPLVPEDAEILSQRFGVPEVADHLISFTAPWSVSQAAAWIETYRWTGKPGFRLAICLQDGTFVGTVGLYGTPLGLAYFIDPALWGQGLAKEAAMLFLTDCFLRFDLGEICSTAFSDNIGSIKVLERLGFVPAKTQAQQGGRPTTGFVLMRNDFEAAHGNHA